MFTSADIQINRATYLIRKSRSVLILGHVRPDGDCVGSVLAMGLFLKYLKKRVYYLTPSSLPRNFNFLPDADRITELSNKIHKINAVDLIIIFDCASFKQTGLERYFPNGHLPISSISIDHHISNTNFAQINIIDKDASSTAEVLYRIFKRINLNIDKYIATCLLMGICTDTDSFRTPNTSVKTLSIASQLLIRGADLKCVVKNTLQNKSVSSLKLWGIVFSRLKKNRKYGIVSTIITRKDLVNCKAGQEDLERITNFLNCVPNVKATLVLSEEKGGKIKGSLRTLMKNVDVSVLAGILGGGGHKKAAGFEIMGRLSKVKKNWIIK